ncbi:MAG: YwaF family protein [Lachnospiraceae bacterium]|nr:YwaF family protein [Lachnospiraceae bacterium]
MYAVIHGILADRKGGEVFTLFSGWHFFYIALTVLTVIGTSLLIRKKSSEKKRKTAEAFGDAAFALYILDFFLMPFAYEEIDIEKLPFHICTAMCVACFLGRHVPKLKNFRIHFALLGMISNLVYLIYPAGVMWHRVHPLSYRVIQTLLFHGIMTVYGVLTFLFDEEKLEWKSFPRDIAVIVGMTAWAILGNLFYTGGAGKYANDFNWFFVTMDPFRMMNERVAPIVMPFVNIAVFLAAEAMFYGLCHVIRSIKRRR